MPFKHNAAHRHRIPKARYRLRNWPAYEAGLKPARAAAICRLWVLRWRIYNLTCGSVMCVPGTGNLFWGVEASNVRHNRHATAGDPHGGRRAGADLRQGYAQSPVSPGATILIDAQNHFDCRATVASVLTDNGTDDAGRVPNLPEQIGAEIASVTANGAYDGELVYRGVARRQGNLIQSMSSFRRAPRQ